MVYWGWLGSNVFTILLKYLGQSASTLALLLAKRPDAIFVMAPPVLAALVVYFYSLVARVPFVIDAHTAAFLHPRWSRLQWLQRFLCRRAVTTIVTNEHLAQLVRSSGSHSTIVRDVPVTFPRGSEFKPEGDFTVGVVCSFNDDEPIAEILRAAAELQDVRFYMTGNPRYLDPALHAALPCNVTLTGFLPEATYGSLLSQVDVVMTLTTRDHTMLRGAYEAVYQSTPVIVSNWPLLREAFDQGAIHVDNSAAQLVLAVRQIRVNLGAYREAVRQLRRRKYDEWSRSRRAIHDRVKSYHGHTFTNSKVAASDAHSDF